MDISVDSVLFAVATSPCRHRILSGVRRLSLSFTLLCFLLTSLETSSAHHPFFDEHFCRFCLFCPSNVAFLSSLKTSFAHHLFFDGHFCRFCPFCPCNFTFLPLFVVVLQPAGQYSLSVSVFLFYLSRINIKVASAIFLGYFFYSLLCWSLPTPSSPLPPPPPHSRPSFCHVTLLCFSRFLKTHCLFASLMHATVAFITVSVLFLCFQVLHTIACGGTVYNNRSVCSLQPER
jgi:hypothetical protein